MSICKRACLLTCLALLLPLASISLPAATLEDFARAAALSAAARRMLDGRGNQNVFGAPDVARPLVAVRFRPGSLESENRARLATWGEAVDFAVISSPEAALLCEQNGVPWAGDCNPDFGDRPVSGTHRLGWLAPPGRQESCSGSRQEPIVPVIDKAEGPLPGVLASGGAPAVGIRIVPASSSAARPEGLLIERRGDVLRVSPPLSGSTAFVEWDVTLPPGVLLTFSARNAGAEGDGASLAVRVSGTLKPEVLWQQDLMPGKPAVEAALDLSKWAGSRVRVRFDISAGASRDAGGDLVEIERPLLEASGSHASLMEISNWWQARCGYRPLDEQGALRDVLTGPSGPAFDADTLTAALQWAEREGRRAVLVDVHPTGSLDTASPAAFGLFWARALQRGVAAAIFDDAANGMDSLAGELARWRNSMHLLLTGGGDSAQPARRDVIFIRSEVTARQEGLYCLEDGGLLRIPDRFAAFHLSDRCPVSGFTDRQGLVLVFPRRGARVLDSGICFPERIERQGRELEVALRCPAALAGTASSPFRIVLWTPDSPDPGLKTGDVWTVSPLGDGFYEAACSRPGLHVVRIPGAVRPRGPMEWTPMDH
ncbi:MAG: hypothetical protein KatS3mg024_1173 [Armatimonadota bacterium]|nr:MAG: hypothetical protein KatS3mg024_1173 [Armatimonadota bacterium]